MASRPVSLRVPPEVDQRFARIKAALDKPRDGEAILEMMRTYPLAWRPSQDPMFRARPRGLERGGPPDLARNADRYLYGPSERRPPARRRRNRER